mmetsp:Transcript_63495/g.113298  ORF Transcript_63495/g.113298 Transcript_63495/m.113298 type:complete len:254 (+) Transcript_63495:1089-1850(+)
MNPNDASQKKSNPILIVCVCHIRRGHNLLSSLRTVCPSDANHNTLVLVTPVNTHVNDIPDLNFGHQGLPNGQTINLRSLPVLQLVFRPQTCIVSWRPRDHLMHHSDGVMTPMFIIQPFDFRPEPRPEIRVRQGLWRRLWLRRRLWGLIAWWRRGAGGWRILVVGNWGHRRMPRAFPYIVVNRNNVTMVILRVHMVLNAILIEDGRSIPVVSIVTSGIRHQMPPTNEVGWHSGHTRCSGLHVMLANDVATTTIS